MKARTVVVELEIETDASIKALRSARSVLLRDKDRWTIGEFRLVEAPRLNVIRSTKPKGRR